MNRSAEMPRRRSEPNPISPNGPERVVSFAAMEMIFFEVPWPFPGQIISCRAVVSALIHCYRWLVLLGNVCSDNYTVIQLYKDSRVWLYLTLQQDLKLNFSSVSHHSSKLAHYNAATWTVFISNATAWYAEQVYEPRAPIEVNKVT